jgi:uncharacterized membrane protein YfcA
MDYLLICTIAVLVSALTLFSGFGLGTLLMPAFALFFPVEVAVAATAIVHLANNLFKAVLVGKHASFRTVTIFAGPAALCAAIGAFLLVYVSGFPPLFTYEIRAHQFDVTFAKLIIATLIAAFSILDLVPRFERLSFDERYMPLGGALSGFFGGLSGLQGALRSAFLIRAGLDKQEFVATGVLSAVIVDISRLIIYGVTFFSQHFSVLGKGGETGLIVAGTIAAWLGSFIGVRLLGKITLRTLQLLVGILLLIFSAALAAGII